MKVQRLTCYTVSTLRVMTQGRSRLRSRCKHGSVKGSESNPCPYCDPLLARNSHTYPAFFYLTHTDHPRARRVPFCSLLGYHGTYQMEVRMAVNVKLSDALVETAKRYGSIEHRSVPKQIEYWSQIGKIAAENPDLPFTVIRDILIADQEEPVGEYQFG